METDIRDFPRDACSVASTLEIVGERWTLHVLREAFLGVRRFEDFRRNIGVARNILSDRLNTLVAEGILRRERYSEHPPRYEYRLTRKGVDLYGILIELMKWGNRWTPQPEGRHSCCGTRIAARDGACPGVPGLRRAGSCVGPPGAPRAGDDAPDTAAES